MMVSALRALAGTVSAIWQSQLWIRSALVLVACAFGGWIWLGAIGDNYPVSEWLFWSIGRIWLYGILQSFACVSFGYFFLKRGLGIRRRRVLETLYLSFLSGLLFLVLAMYAGGALGAFNEVFALCLAAAMLIMGGRDALGDAMKWLQQPEVDPVLSRTARTVRLVAVGFGVICLAVVYLQMMTPHAINFDAAWCHLTVSQDFARHGTIVPFPADYARNHPQLAAMAHTWGWIMPGLSQAERWMMALHDEFFVLVWTLVGIGACAEWMLRMRAGVAWAAFFFFPSIFVYDMNPGGAADHYLAFFGPAMLLGIGRLLEGFRRADAIILGLAAGGALHTKYQAVYLILPVVVLLMTGLVWNLFRHVQHRFRATADVNANPGELALSLLSGAAAFAIVVAPHFIKNWVFYRNPVLPFMQTVFTETTPSVPNAPLLVDQLFKDRRWVPEGTLLERVWSSLEMTAIFHVEPHYSFTNNVPNFGSLFVLLAPFLLLVKQPRRLWIGFLLGWGYVFCWAMTFRVDRNLQGIVPVLAAVTAALLVRAWQLGLLARLGCAALLVLHTIWSGDALFYSGHARIKASIDMIRGGFEGRRENRFNFRSTYVDINEKLPKDAKVLLHRTRMSLGIERDVYMDWPGQQGLFSYETARNPRDLYEMYRAAGITHLLHEPGRKPTETKQEDVLFTDFIHNYARSLGRFGRYELLAMPKQPPPESPDPYLVLVHQVPGYADGFYRVTQLSTYDKFTEDLRQYPQPAFPWPKESKNALPLARQASAVVARDIRRLPTPVRTLIKQEFEKGQEYRRHRFAIYVRD